MERLSNGSKTTPVRRRNAPKPAEAGEARLARSDPRSRAVNRSSRAGDYVAFSAEVLRELDPRGPLQRLAADHVVHSAWRLKEGLDRRAGRDAVEEPGADAEGSKARPRPAEIDRASRSFKEALEAFDYLNDRPWTAPAPIEVDRLDDVDPFEDDTKVFPNEWPIVPSASVDDLPDEPESSDEPVPSWRDRLVYDFDVSDISPVVKGTWITVGHVVSLIVDGWSWADILRAHPELTEDDIRTCVAYAMDEENSAP